MRKSVDIQFRESGFLTAPVEQCENVAYNIAARVLLDEDDHPILVVGGAFGALRSAWRSRQLRLHGNPLLTL